MKKIKRAVCRFAFAALVLTLGFSAANAQTAGAKNKNVKSSKKTARKTIDRIVYEPDAEMLAALKSKVSVVESKKDWAKLDSRAPVYNAGKSRAAYVAEFKMKNEPDAFETIVVVYEKTADKFFEIRGIDDFPWRLFERLRWISADVLEFEQWVNPNNGGRYRVNLKTGKIVAAGYVRSN